MTDHADTPTEHAGVSASTVGAPLTPRHQAAHSYATKHRLLLIPLEEKEKRPAFKTGPNHQTLATAEPNIIDGWWNYRDYNIGLPCTPNRLAVIDVDGPLGEQHLQQLENEHGPLPTTWMQSSSRDDRPSCQYIYRWPNGEMVPTSRISEQLEVRAHGAQIVVAPSIHPTGSTYRWLIPPTDLPDGPPELPTWILEELTRPKPATEPASEPTRPQPPTPSRTLAEKRLDGLVTSVASAAEGDRNTRLNHAAYTAARIPGLTDQQITDRLTTAAQTAGLENREIQATIKSGIESGHADGPDPEHAEPAVAAILTRPNQPDNPEQPPNSEWAVVDLQPILSGDVEHLDPPPTILQRDDGPHLLYKGELNWLSGEPETGKSWLAQLAAAQQIRQENHVLYIDLEDTPSRIVGRLTSLDLPTQSIAQHFHYIRPSVGTTPTDIQQLLELAAQCSLAVVDGTTDLHLIHGLDSENNRDAAEMVSKLLRPLANAGPAVLPLDHVTKNKENRGRYAIGAQHKLAAVRGASYHLETIHPMGRGAHGQARLYITKDRPGHIRGEHTLRVGLNRHTAGDFYLDATTRNIGTRIAAPTEAKEFAEAALARDILEYVTEYVTQEDSGVSQNKIEKNVPGKGERIRDTIAELVEQGELIALPQGRGHLYLPGGTLQ